MFSTVLCFYIKEYCLTDQSQVANSLDPEIQADHKAWPFFSISRSFQSFPDKKMGKVVILCLHRKGMKIVKAGYMVFSKIGDLPLFFARLCSNSSLQILDLQHLVVC